MKRLLQSFIFCLVLISGCETNHGKRLEFNNAELFYTDNVSKQQALKLGEFLVQEGSFNGPEISVQLDKNNGTYLFRMATITGAEQNTVYVEEAKALMQLLSSEVFNNAPVNFHFCDSLMHTKMEIPFEY
jgi:hypothetical protein